VWFDDESRFGQQGSLTHVWAPRGTRPRRWRQTEYKWVYLFGAACPATGAAVGWIMPTSNTYCMNLHLAHLSRTAAAEVQIVLVLDNAGWHVSKGLRVPANISLVPLPPYAPELNAMERVWLYLKSHYLANRAYRDHEELYAAGCEAWQRFTADPDRVRSVCHSPWAESALSN
jgi:hypothetical protein